MEQLSEKPTLEDFKNIIDKNAPISDEEYEALLGKLKIDSSKFKEIVSDFYRNTVIPSRKKLKVVIDTINPAVGNVSESKSTQHIMGSIGRMQKAMNLDNKEMAKFVSLVEGGDKEGIEFLQNYFQKAVKGKEFGSEQYQALINTLVDPKASKGVFYDNSATESLFAQLYKIIDKIKPKTDDSTQGLLNAIIKGKEDGTTLFDIMGKALSDQKVNIDTFTTRAAICANFEARLQEGKIQYRGMDLRAPENAEFLKVARKFIYSGNSSFTKNCGDMKNLIANPQKEFQSLINVIFDESAFKNEPEIVQIIAKGLCVTDINDGDRSAVQAIGGNAKQYAVNVNFVQQLKNHMTSFMNNKSWKMCFVPMLAALIVVTLLAQPFFGNIKKEYPEEEQNGGKN